MNGQGPTDSGDVARDASGLEARQALSALMDGDADDSAAARVCAAWRTGAQVRADWHAYHVIGDVLRTAEQCPSSRGDAAFVEELRRRLVREPVVMAPAAVDATPSPVIVGTVVAARRGAWRAPMAAAAGVAAVATVVFLMRPGLPDAQAPLVAVAPPPVSAPVQSAVPVLVRAPEAAPKVAGTRATAPIVVVHDPRMLRDERLDRYLDAHRQFAEGALSMVPAATVRGVSSLAPER